MDTMRRLGGVWPTTELGKKLCSVQELETPSTIHNILKKHLSLPWHRNLKIRLKDIEKAQGIIYGLAIGDCLGQPTERIKLNEIKRRFGSKGIKELPDPAIFTDDTQLSIAVAEALINSKSFNKNIFMKAIKKEFIRWLHSPENARGPGKSCMQGIQNMENGISWDKSSIKDAMGCGSAMRVAPIGYVLQYNPIKMQEFAHISGICTHNHESANAACIGMTWLIKFALDNIPPSEYIQRLLIITDGMSIEFTRSIDKVRQCLLWEDEEKALKYIGEGWVGHEAVALALYCFLRYPNSYKKTVLRGANSDGDSDSIASIAGAISGAYLGVNSIPKDWIKSVEKTEYLRELAIRLEIRKIEYIKNKNLLPPLCF